MISLEENEQKEFFVRNMSSKFNAWYAYAYAMVNGKTYTTIIAKYKARNIYRNPQQCWQCRIDMYTHNVIRDIVQKHYQSGQCGTEREKQQVKTQYTISK